MNGWKSTLINHRASIKDAIECLNNTGMQIVLIEKDGKLFGTISDGDIRRGLLKGVNLNDGIMSITDGEPISVMSNVSRIEAIKIMELNKIKHLPIVNKDNKLVGLHLIDGSSCEAKAKNAIVIMAGGLGKRMMPYTENIPKPMLEVHGKPILRHILDKAKSEGFHEFFISINYLGDVIKDYFGSGEELGIKISYLTEDKPLGTAGALSLLPMQKKPIIVTNGDVLSDIVLKDILNFHKHNLADATMAIRPHEWQNPFGVVEIDDISITDFIEKPIIRSFVNAGVYVINPQSLALLLKNKYIDMPNFFQYLKEKNQKVIAYPIHEHWSDIGRPEDLTLANSKENN